MNHPIQPLAPDSHGTIRFKANAIVRHLLDQGGLDLNDLADIEFPQNDWEQFAQLIGYSLSGFSELSYVSNETYAAASRMEATGETEEQARISTLEQTLEEIRKHIRGAAEAAFRIHPDDLQA